MLMGNQIIRNTISLTRIKLRNLKTYILKLFAIILFIFLTSILPSILQLFRYKDIITYYTISDFSFFYFIGSIVAITLACVVYRNTNNRYAAYPQTNTSRFLSTQLVMYIWIILISFISLILHLLQYSVFKILASLRNNIIIVFEFNLGLVIIGCFVYAMYGILAVSFISFIATLIRKFNVIAIIILLLIVAFLINDSISIKSLIAHPLNFFTGEGSIIIFYIKGILTWFILLVASIIVNRYTCYYKTRKTHNNAIVGIVGLTLIIVVSCIRAAFMPDKLTIQPVIGLLPYDDSPWIERTITLDVSDYEDLSKLSATSNIVPHIDNINPDYNILYLNPMGDELVIYYRFPIYTRNGYNVAELMNPDISASLDGHVLNITYNYKRNQKAVFISPWTIMKQFDIYKDKNLYFNVPMLYSSNSRGNGNIRIAIE